MYPLAYAVCRMISSLLPGKSALFICSWWNIFYTKVDKHRDEKQHSQQEQGFIVRAAGGCLSSSAAIVAGMVRAVPE